MRLARARLAARACACAVLASGCASREPPQALAPTQDLLEVVAVVRLHVAAGGIPRVLNQLATQALIEGMARGAERVDGAVAAAVASERDWDGVPAGTRG